LRAGLLDPFGGKKRVEQELDALCARLLDEVRATPGDEVVALRGERRLTQVFVPRALESLGTSDVISAPTAAATVPAGAAAGDVTGHVAEAGPVHTPSDTMALPAALREQGVYLITGGLGGLGLTVADYL